MNLLEILFKLYYSNFVSRVILKFKLNKKKKPTPYLSLFKLDYCEQAKRVFFYPSGSFVMI